MGGGARAPRACRNACVHEMTYGCYGNVCQCVHVVYYERTRTFKLVNTFYDNVIVVILVVVTVIFG